MNIWMSLTKNEAEKIYNNWENSSPILNIHPNYLELRDELLDIYTKSLSKLKISKDEIKSNTYNFDLTFGLKMYYLLVNKHNFNERLASEDDVWRYLSINILPDIIFERWGLNPNRFYLESRRIWLKSLWWYIHLSWQGNIEETYNILKNNTTDEIVQIVERSGPGGYRLELSRNIMKFYGSVPIEKKKRGTQIFRKVMKLNTARSRVIEPALVNGGEKQYVKELFEYFGEDTN